MTTPLLLCVCLAGISLFHAVDAASTCCATTDVNIRSGPSTRYKKVGLLTRGSCLPTTGLSSSLKWVKVVYGKETRYIYKRYCPIKVPSPSRPPSTTAGCANIIPRSEWGARPAKSTTRMRSVPGNVYVHHTTGSPCTSSDDCKKKIRGHQYYHMNKETDPFSDIGYSFLIGEDGNVYEGRGWRVVGAHTKGHNSDGYGIAFIGDFTSRNPNTRAQSAFHKLIECGISIGQLKSNYALIGHRDVGSTECPGNTLYNLVKGWPQYNNPRG